MKKTAFVVDVRPVRSETITAREYRRLIEKSPGLIERAQFIPPTTGHKGFGKFFVRYSRPRHRALELEHG